MCVCMCVYNEAADEGHMKMSVACVSYTRLAAHCAYVCVRVCVCNHTHTMYIQVIYNESADERHMKIFTILVCVALFVAPTVVADRQPKPTYIV